MKTFTPFDYPEIELSLVDEHQIDVDGETVNVYVCEAPDFFPPTGMLWVYLYGCSLHKKVKVSEEFHLFGADKYYEMVWKKGKKAAVESDRLKAELRDELMKIIKSGDE